MDVPFKVLTAFKGGVVLRSVPEGKVLRLSEGDTVMIDTSYGDTPGKVEDVAWLKVDDRIGLRITHPAARI
jgi:hypothetical protein